MIIVGSIMIVGCQSNSTTTMEQNQIKEKQETQQEETINKEGQVETVSSKKEESKERIDSIKEYIELKGCKIGVFDGWSQTIEENGEVKTLKHERLMSEISIKSIETMNEEEVRAYINNYSKEDYTIEEGELNCGHYIEVSGKIKEHGIDLIDDMLAEGVITEENIEKMGGREQFLQTLNTFEYGKKEIYIMLSNGHILTMYSGIYREEQEEVGKVIVDMIHSISLIEGQEKQTDLVETSSNLFEFEDFTIEFESDWYEKKNNGTSARAFIKNNIMAGVFIETIENENLKSIEDYINMLSEEGYSLEIDTVSAGSYILAEAAPRTFTADYINQCIKEGTLTKEQVEQAGGVEALVEVLNSNSDINKEVYLPLDNGKTIYMGIFIKPEEESVMEETIEKLVASITLK